MNNTPQTQWRIWSNEHKEWWMPNGCGYTKSRESAGLYSFEEAVQLCASANDYLTDEQEPNETMVLAGKHP